ncbi:alpha/beta hydrolase [Saccharopolyspora erythraea]|uniref:DUF1023 domain-containing protein n=1 Tax=Saccharopolyspora erythraea TaxID=1836 RepID=A0ABN1DNE1_SACER|nr:alpha/beta hydrolase [Saccharopolyspora erythraea]
MTLNTWVAGSPATMRTYARQVRAFEGAIERVATGQYQVRTKAAGEWEGQASEVFQGWVIQQGRDGDALAQLFPRVAQAVETWSDEIDTVKARMEQAKQVARDGELMVADLMIYPPKLSEAHPPPPLGDNPSPDDIRVTDQANARYEAIKALNEKKAAAWAEAQATVQQARGTERVAHEALIRALDVHRATLEAIPQSAAWGEAGAHPSSPASMALANAATLVETRAAEATRGMFEQAMGQGPAAVRGCWASLSDAQRADLSDRYPQMVGSADGVPAVVRDDVNRARLAQQRQALVDRIRDEKARLDPESENAQDWYRIEQMEQALDGIEALEEKIGPPNTGHFLLGIDSTGADGRGRVIVASGNPDTADHVMTMVPGTTADLGGAAGDVQRNDVMLGLAREMAPRQEVAAVMWCDYESPAEVFPYALSGSYSEDAGGDLAKFQEGLRATHDGPPSHNTILGHSYGSTVVGEAARDYGVHADDIAFLGSPGVGVENASELGVQPEHVWSGTSDSDAIEYGVTARPDQWFREGDYHIHGHDPSDPSFGARELPTDPNGGHTEYWDKKASLEGMARLTVGRRKGCDDRRHRALRNTVEAGSWSHPRLATSRPRCRSGHHAVCDREPRLRRLRRGAGHRYDVLHGVRASQRHRDPHPGHGHRMAAPAIQARGFGGGPAAPRRDHQLGRWTQVTVSDLPAHQSTRSFAPERTETASRVICRWPPRRCGCWRPRTRPCSASPSRRNSSCARRAETGAELRLVAAGAPGSVENPATDRLAVGWPTC